jgi:hypothetical protein
MACSCSGIRHYFITKKTQRWEEKHFNPVRAGSRVKKKNVNASLPKNGKHKQQKSKSFILKKNKNYE